MIKIKKYIDNNNIFDDIILENTKESILDKSTIYANGNLLYGSIKENRKYSYMVTKIYKYNLEEIDKDIYSVSDYIYKLSLRRYSNEANLEYRKKIEYTQETTYKKDKNYERQMNISNITTANITKEEYNTIKELVNILNIRRAEDYIEWRNVGFALHSISETLIDIFIEFSKKCESKFDINRCNVFWKSIQPNKNGFTKKSLHWWAKEDDLDKYSYIQMQSMLPLIDSILGGQGDYDIAKIVNKLYGEYYVCVNNEDKKVWYMYTGTRWKIDTGGKTLRVKIVDDLIDRIIYCKKILLQQTKNSENDLTALNDALKKKIAKLTTKLKSSSAINSILKAAGDYMYDDSFESKLNTKCNLLGFENGVYDLGIYDKENNMWITKPHFRIGYPDDYISLSVGYNYTEYKESDVIFNDIITYFKQVQPNENVREYLLRFIASTLHGKIFEQKMVFWIGKAGQNGKSTTSEFIGAVLGDYSGVQPISFFCEKRKGSSTASPDLADIVSKRYIEVGEPGATDEIQLSNFKLITSGNDKIPYRSLYSNIIQKFISQAKFALLCNKLPYIPTVASNDGGTWRRIVVVNWTSEFVDEPCKPNQYKKDKNLKEKMLNWVEPFMWLLINKYYIDFMMNGLREPQEVQESTNRYKLMSDNYQLFIDEFLEKTLTTEVIKLTDLHNKFRTWFTLGFSGKCPNKTELYENLEHKGIECNKIVVRGVKFKS